MATASKATGFGVKCPFCHDEDGELRIDVNDIRSVKCPACDEEFTPAEAAAKLADQVRRWEAVARWIDLAGEMSAAG